ncbi:hypothetical protein HZA96_06325 [Candidatus Woesearchaeota archaeon]|nr:hypothetical protein [Candidatus Woesearchaeota archaeon]
MLERLADSVGIRLPDLSLDGILSALVGKESKANAERRMRDERDPRIRNTIDKSNAITDRNERYSFIQKEYRHLIENGHLDMLLTLRETVGILPSSETVSFGYCYYNNNRYDQEARINHLKEIVKGIPLDEEVIQHEYGRYLYNHRENDFESIVRLMAITGIKPSNGIVQDAFRKFLTEHNFVSYEEEKNIENFAKFFAKFLINLIRKAKV